ncbi:MAG: VOC family protein [Pseudolabrys sp.]
MPRSLDHIVHAVHDLDAAAEAYARLGFIVGARNKHPGARITASCSSMASISNC